MWRESEIMLKFQEKKHNRHHGVRKWMTKAEVARKYNNDESIANEICNAKLSDPEVAKSQTKPHPDAPQNKAWHL